jgi:hypothetical protein
MYYLFYTILFLIEITQETVLNWFNIEAPLNQKINEYRELYGLIPNDDSIYIEQLKQNYESAPAFSLDTLRLIIEGYWEKIRDTGLGLSEIDDLIVLIVVIRLIVLTIRYNIFTGFIITGISVLAGYLWYSTFISTLFVYENALYKNALTFRLGVDANQIRRMLQAKVMSSSYQIRLTNPVGIAIYALGTGSVYEGHRIDPISMFMSSIPEGFPKKDWIEGTYYLFYRKIIPVTMRAILDFIDAFTSYAVYTIITRVNKRYCPYLIRWHWTLLIILKFFEPFITYLIYRINDYSYNIVYPQILKAKEYGITLSQSTFEMQLLNYICFTIIIIHLSFLLFAMLHALCGQYFYIPFFTENVELHIGERNKLDKYSGGYTAWQDEKTLSNGQFKLKLWYGWFGRGTNNEGDIIPTVIRYIKKLITMPFVSIWKLFKNFTK